MDCVPAPLISSGGLIESCTTRCRAQSRASSFHRQSSIAREPRRHFRQARQDFPDPENAAKPCNRHRRVAIAQAGNNRGRHRVDGKRFRRRLNRQGAGLFPNDHWRVVGGVFEKMPCHSRWEPDATVRRAKPRNIVGVHAIAAIKSHKVRHPGAIKMSACRLRVFADVDVGFHHVAPVVDVVAN